MTFAARSRYFTPNEVCVHNTVDDLWVSFLGKVFDLTPLCEKFKGSLHKRRHSVDNDTRCYLNFQWRLAENKHRIWLSQIHDIAQDWVSANIAPFARKKKKKNKKKINLTVTLNGTTNWHPL